MGSSAAHQRRSVHSRSGSRCRKGEGEFDRLRQPVHLKRALYIFAIITHTQSFYSQTSPQEQPADTKRRPLNLLHERRSRISGLSIRRRVRAFRCSKCTRKLPALSVRSYSVIRHMDFLCIETTRVVRTYATQCHILRRLSSMTMSYSHNNHGVKSNAAGARRAANDALRSVVHDGSVLTAIS